MKNLKLYLVISIGINAVLLYILFKPVEKSTEFEHMLLDRIKKEYKANKDRILRDSLRFENKIKVSENKISKLNSLRKNELTKYEIELTKLQSITTDSAYTYILDSVKKVCCSNGNR